MIQLHRLKKSWKLAFLASFIAVLATTGFAISTLDTKASSAVAATELPIDETLDPRVTVQEVTNRIVAPTLKLTGRVVAREEVIVGSQIDNLRILQIKVDVGDVVAKGQVMAVLDQEAVSARLAQNDSEIAKANALVAQSMANIAEAEVLSKQASLALERASKLITTGATSQENWDEKDAEAAAASARLTAQRQYLLSYEADRNLAITRRREIELDLKHTHVRAPEAGVVFERGAVIGQTVSVSGGPLFKLIRDGALELSTRVVDKNLPLLAIGQEAHVGVGNDKVDVQGTVRMIGPVVSADTLTADVRIALHDARDLRPGLIAHAWVQTATFSSVAVVHSALLRADGGWAVRVVDKGIVATRQVRAGSSDRNGVSILSGLSSGDLVIVRAGPLLRDGDRVVPVTAVFDGPKSQEAVP